MRAGWSAKDGRALAIQAVQNADAVLFNLLSVLHSHLARLVVTVVCDRHKRNAHGLLLCNNGPIAFFDDASIYAYYMYNANTQRRNDLPRKPRWRSVCGVQPTSQTAGSAQDARPSSTPSTPTPSLHRAATRSSLRPPCLTLPLAPLRPRAMPK